MTSSSFNASLNKSGCENESLVKRIINSVFGNSRLAPKEKETDIAKVSLDLSKQEAVSNDVDKTDRKMSKSVDPNNPSKIIMRGVQGTVVWFSPVGSFGFIRRHDIDEDVYVHIADIVKYTSRRHVLEAGQEVEFDVIPGFKGSKAIGVTLTGGLPVESTHTVWSFKPFRASGNHKAGENKMNYRGGKAKQEDSEEQTGSNVEKTYNGQDDDMNAKPGSEATNQEKFHRGGKGQKKRFNAGVIESSKTAGNQFKNSSTKQMANGQKKNHYGGRQKRLNVGTEVESVSNGQKKTESADLKELSSALETNDANVKKVGA